MRPVALAGIAFAVGLLLAILLFAPASPLSGLTGGPREVVAVVSNVGTHDADAKLVISYALGGKVGERAFPVRAGDEVRERIGAFDDDLLVQLRVAWTDGTSSRSGENSLLATVDGCSGRDTLVLRWHAQTTRGVSFPVAQTACI